jgi:hypothetical protein
MRKETATHMPLTHISLRVRKPFREEATAYYALFAGKDLLSRKNAVEPAVLFPHVPELNQALAAHDSKVYVPRGLPMPGTGAPKGFAIKPQSTLYIRMPFVIDLSPDNMHIPDVQKANAIADMLERSRLFAKNAAGIAVEKFLKNFAREKGEKIVLRLDRPGAEIARRLASPEIDTTPVIAGLRGFHIQTASFYLCPKGLGEKEVLAHVPPLPALGKNPRDALIKLPGVRDAFRLENA